MLNGFPLPSEDGKGKIIHHIIKENWVLTLDSGHSWLMSRADLSFPTPQFPNERHNDDEMKRNAKSSPKNRVFV
jgi:hypothetical protein